MPDVVVLGLLVLKETEDSVGNCHGCLLFVMVASSNRGAIVVNREPNWAWGEALARGFYDRPAERVAPDLLGKVIVHESGGETVAGRIVETEAYLGEGDEAAHSFAGVTARTRVIFGPPGHAYVYFSYGMHHCLNLVAEAEGRAGCVLIRALEPLAGMHRMFERRPRVKQLRELCSGPGKLTQALGVTLAHYGADVTTGQLTVREARDAARFGVEQTARIGITRSAGLPLRFCIQGNAHVSRARQARRGTTDGACA
jgi:DNA-3-methyladenine glycosylase